LDKYNRMMQLNYHIQEQFREKLKKIQNANFSDNKHSSIKD